MIVRLMPQQIPMFWDLIKPGLVQQGFLFNKGNYALSNEVFQRCLAGMFQVWLLSEEGKLIAGIITQIAKDDILKERTLIIWMFIAAGEPTQALLAEGQAALIKYAESNDCTDVSFHSRHHSIEGILTKWWPGSWKKYTYYSLPIKGA